MPFKDPQKRREYQRSYHSRWYQDNGDRRRAQVRQRRKQTRDWLARLKAAGSCSQCQLSGAIAPWALDYHHINHHDKEATVSYLVGNGYARSRIEAEIAKCELICSNCHRTMHYEEHKAGIERDTPSEEKPLAKRERAKRKSHARRQRKRKRQALEEE